ncbi:hypothetical protein F4821DRAFT_262164 [Hypoxylon rubiginosum]|uniref:Uncharacterized protein n=1 Tax=Hypoxylon rubiginosum TaxID=110542 RepID=A0ACC0CV17_9PEZI|nr:hypothetical protein F4821DRAFT_262164 [Hypoxylon rubiginosum]
MSAEAQFDSIEAEAVILSTMSRWSVEAFIRKADEFIRELNTEMGLFPASSIPDLSNMLDKTQGYKSQAEYRLSEIQAEETLKQEQEDARREDEEHEALMKEIQKEYDDKEKELDEQRTMLDQERTELEEERTRLKEEEERNREHLRIISELIARDQAGSQPY